MKKIYGIILIAFLGMKISAKDSIFVHQEPKGKIGSFLQNKKVKIAVSVFVVGCLGMGYWYWRNCNSKLKLEHDNPQEPFFSATESDNDSDMPPLEDVDDDLEKDLKEGISSPVLLLDLDVNVLEKDINKLLISRLSGKAGDWIINVRDMEYYYVVEFHDEKGKYECHPHDSDLTRYNAFVDHMIGCLVPYEKYEFRVSFFDSQQQMMWYTAVKVKGVE